MKQCLFCDMQVKDSLALCPYCCSNAFVALCPICGTRLVDGTCQTCTASAAAHAQAREREYARAQKQEAIKKANAGLVWKCMLAFFIPFIGGYFLVGPYVKTGPKVFAIVWTCVFYLAGVSGGGFEDTSVGMIVFITLLFLGPVIYWLYHCALKAKLKVTDF